MQYILNGVKPHHCFPTEHLFERKDSTSQKLCVFVMLFHSYGRAYSHVSSPNGYIIYIRRLFQKKKNILLHSFFQSTDSQMCQGTQEALYIQVSTDSSQATGLGTAQDISGHWYHKRSADLLHHSYICLFAVNILIINRSQQSRLII